MRRMLCYLIGTFALAGCIGTVYTPTPYNPAVWPYNDALSQPYYGIANPNGITPCGIFDAMGHGFKVVPLSEFPRCEAERYTVYCLNGQSQWTNEFVLEIAMSDDSTAVEFQSRQDGLCALFPEG